MRLPFLFLLLGLPACLFNAVLVPAGEVPDELSHILRADSLLSGNLVGKRRTLPNSPVPTAGFTAHASLFTVWGDEPGRLGDRQVTRSRQAQRRDMPWGPAEFIPVSNTAPYMPLLYVPTAMTLGVTRVAGMSPYDAILTARLVNGLMYLAIGAAALMLAQRGRGVLFVGLLLPTSLSLAASCNQDGFLIALSGLAVALLTRGSQRAFWAAAALTAVVLAVKPVYLPLAGIVAVLAPGLKARAGSIILTTAPAILWFLYAQRRAGVSLRAYPPQLPGPLWTGDPAATFAATDAGLQLQVLLSRPWNGLTMLLNSIWSDWSLKWPELVGAFGRLELFMPGQFYSLAYVAIAAALLEGMLATLQRPVSLPAFTTLFGVGCLFAALVTIYVGLYVSWTPIGLGHVEGVQGRYMIQLLLYSAAILPQLPVPNAEVGRSVLRIPAIAMAAVGAAIVPGLTISTFYLR